MSRARETYSTYHIDITFMLQWWFGLWGLVCGIVAYYSNSVKKPKQYEILVVSSKTLETRWHDPAEGKRYTNFQEYARVFVALGFIFEFVAFILFIV